MKFTTLFSFITIILIGCTQTGIDSEATDDEINITLSANQNFVTRAVSPIDSLTPAVNRILIIPFQKLNTALPDKDSTNFIPAWTFARQYDVNTFPVNSLKISLPKSFTYKVFILGYNQNDYNYNTPNASTNRFNILSQPTPTTLANFELSPKAPNEVPEFFTCFCDAYINSVNTGKVFTPSDNVNINLSGNLKRIVSGLGIYLTNIPAYVTSITLSAQNMVKTIRLIDTTATSVQTPGTGIEVDHIIRQMIPQSGKVSFNEFLLPTKAANKTLLYLNVIYDTRNTLYTIKVPDGIYSSSNKITLPPNGAVKIRGNFTQTGISFEVNNDINLDDPAWDGLQ